VSLNNGILSMFFDASLLVKGVMGILLCLSMISWTLIFYRGSFLKLRAREWHNFMNKFKNGTDFIRKYQQLKSKKSSYGMHALFIAGVDEFIAMKKAGADTQTILTSVSRAMNIVESQELDKLEQNISILATIGSTSPYIGLFGTVWGIMTSFQALGAVQQATISMVAPGISEALIATAMGLFAAIPAVIAYNRYASKIDFLANQYGLFKEQFVALLNRKLQHQEVVAGIDYD
jgi:biopolymer transport protein TolQ